MRSLPAFGAVVVSMACARVAVAQIDNLKTLVSSDLAAGSLPLLAAAYDPATDTAYTSVSILSGEGNDTMLRRITGVSTANPVSTAVMDRDQFSYYLRDGDLTRTLRSASIAGMTFNPAPVGAIGTRGSLWFTDSGVTRLPNGSNITDPAATKRVYRHTLGDVPAPGNDYASVSTVLKPLVSMANIQAAAGQSPSTTDTGLSRQLAFSPDGQNVYGVDNSATFGGVYRINPTSGAISRILTVQSTLGCEPAVVKVGSADRIYFRTNNNPGGISYIDHNPTTNTTSAETVLFTSTQLKDFMQVGIEPCVSNLTNDAAGNLYFFDGFGGNGNYRLLKYDTAGRLSKVSTRTERDQFFTGSITDGTLPSVQQYKMQAYAYNDPTAGAVTGISYVESTPLRLVAAVTAYLPTDFNRDGLENATDLSLFKAKLTANGVVSDINDARFDLNGNRTIDYNDVKVAQTFQGFRNGDADLDRKVNTTDFNYLAGNFGKPANAIWTEGDFDGNGLIDSLDFNILTANYGQAPLSAPSLGSVVPEPASVGLLTIAGLTSLRRRR